MRETYIDQWGFDSKPHMELSSKNNVEIFLTTCAAVLEDREELEKHYNFKIMTPQEMSTNE